jgi:hypothetical protein
MVMTYLVNGVNSQMQMAWIINFEQLELEWKPWKCVEFYYWMQQKLPYSEKT